MRRLAALIGHLPPESAYLRATDQWWTTEHELSAGTVELLHAVLVGLARMSGSKRKVTPLRVPRPGDVAPAPRRRQSFLSLIGEDGPDGQAG